MLLFCHPKYRLTAPMLFCCFFVGSVCCPVACPTLAPPTLSWQACSALVHFAHFLEWFHPLSVKQNNLFTNLFQSTTQGIYSAYVKPLQSFAVKWYLFYFIFLLHVYQLVSRMFISWSPCIYYDCLFCFSHQVRYILPAKIPFKRLL